MKSKLLYILLFFSISLSAQMQESDLLKYPKFEKVVSRYFSNHLFNKTFSAYYFSFEKKPTGWFLMKVPKLNPHDVNIELLWDLKTKKFSNNLGPVRNSQKQLQGYINRTRSNYSIHPFYGYPNFELDILDQFENQTQLSDSTLFSLAIANGNIATRIARNTKAIFTPKQQTFRGLESTQPSTSDSILFYIEKATTHYQNLIQQNKKFIVNHQEITNQYALDQVNYALIFESILQPEKANLFWHNIPFSKAVIDYSKNVLMECDSNSILFSHNEMDTYPLLYLQKKGFRKDVSVINLNLLKFSWYRSWIDKLISPFSLAINTLNDPRLLLTQMQKGKFKKSTNELLNILSSKPDSSLRWLDKNQQIQFVKSQNIFYSPKNDGYEILFSTLPILSIQNLAFIDIVHKKGSSHTIHITDGYQMKAFGIGEKYIKKTGLNYTLKFVHEDFTGSYPIEQDQAAIQKNLAQQTWNANDFKNNPTSNLLFNYTSVYTRLIDSFLKEKKSGSAKSIIQQLEKNHNLLDIPAHFNSFYLIYLYQQLELNNEIKAFTTHTVEDYLRQYEKSDFNQKKEIVDQVNAIKSILNYNSSFLMQEINRVFHFI